MTRARQATRLAGALSGALLLALGVSGLAAGQGGPLLEAKSPTGASPGPSRAVYPPQRVPLRFDHALHLGPVGLTCVACHAEARTSDASRDRLLPAGTACDACHGTDHSDLLRVTAPGASTKAADGAALPSACASCHVGHQPDDPGRVERVSLPAANLRFSHRAHAARNISCGWCHGDVRRAGSVTRDALPTMQTCMTCHGAARPARGDADGACVACHLTEETSARLRTDFPSGKLMPQALGDALAHDADWSERHKEVAAADGASCASCHRESDCLACHDGRVRPLGLHPNDWLNLHPIAARQLTAQCGDCHRAQTFCLTCHQRTGITMTGPTHAMAAQGRFHPPAATWRRAHAPEAQRNLGACVSCHIESDCASCHASGSRGGPGTRSLGPGVSPHEPGFSARCGGAFAKNRRPCLVCHTPSDPLLARCR